MSANTIMFALAGGVLPALLWLWFWLGEDRLHPEPRRLIMLTFIAGMAMVALALPLEQLANYVVKEINLQTAWTGILLLVIWAFIEEITKYFAAKKTALNTKFFDEPVDALIYLITAALGFAALENVIFLITITSKYGFEAGFMTGSLRFAGATLLHILSSGIVGAAIGFSFFKREKIKRNFFLGISLATLLHTLFNLLIIKNDGQSIFLVFLPLWILVIVLLVVFEKVKNVKKGF